MVSISNLDEKLSRVRKNFCFYLDIQDHGLARSISRRIQDMGLQQEVFLTSRVSHVIRSRGVALATCARREGRRADAMLQRVQPEPRQPSTNHRYVTLTVQKAISLLDKLYDTFFAASRKSHVRLFTKHFIKIEFLDKLCRPVVKEFDEWPTISLEPDPPREKKNKEDSLELFTNNNNLVQETPEKMTRKSRPRIKEKEEKEPKGGYCEMCNADYADAALHRRSPHHLSFVRDHANFLALDSLIRAGPDVNAFLDKAAPLNGERRSQRKACNGDADSPRGKRCRRSQSPDSTVNGVDDERRTPRNTRCSRKTAEEDRQYYKVVGVSTKLRSSGGFNSSKRKESPPTVNGAKPLVVKFRKVRRSELSVLSDEAEQFMFPKRASSTSSTSSEDTDDDKVLSPRKTPPKPPSPLTERRRLARPLALKEESSEEDSWSEYKRRPKRRAPVVTKRVRRIPFKIVSEPPEEIEPEPAADQPEPTPIEIKAGAPQEVEIAITEEAAGVSPLREAEEKCMKWEDGKLKYTPAVEQLQFAFESVPASEPWFEAFKRQDEDKVLTKNVPQYFALYCTKAPKLPYEIGQLPPLKPNCCPLSDLVKQREEKPGPSRTYGTRGFKQQKIRKRTALIQALESHPRKSPREHASTLAILGSAGLLHRRKFPDDTKSTASEDTISDTQSNVRLEPVLSETQEASERLQQFLSEVFEDAGEFELSEGALEDGAAVTTSTNIPDVSSLMSECEDCDLIRNELKEAATQRPKGRRGKFKKKNKTGWPSKKKNKKGSRTNSVESQKTESLDRSSAEPPDDETTQEMISEEENMSETEETTIIAKSDEDSQDKDEKTLKEDSVSQENMDVDSSDNKLLIDLKVLVDDEKTKAEDDEEEDVGKKSRSSSEDDKELRKKKRVLASLCEWKQPVVRVARVDATSRWLRSAGRGRIRYRL